MKEGVFNLTFSENVHLLHVYFCMHVLRQQATFENMNTVICLKCSSSIKRFEMYQTLNFQLRNISGISGIT